MLTVGELRLTLQGIPDDMPVLYQRIEDVYFNEHNWKGERYIYEWYRGREPDYSEAVPVFNAGPRAVSPESDERIFVLEAHY